MTEINEERLEARIAELEEELAAARAQLSGTRRAIRLRFVLFPSHTTPTIELRKGEWIAGVSQSFAQSCAWIASEDDDA